MVKYNCQRCGFKTDHKNNFRKHLNRKNICKPKLKEMNKCELINLNGFNEHTYIGINSAKTRQNSAKTRQIPPKLVKNNSNKYECDYCNCYFTRKDSLKKHLNSRCKNKKKENELLKKILSEKEKLINKMIQDNEDKNQIISKLIIELSNNTKTVNNNSHNKTVNIIINNYGEENTDYITEKTIKKLINKPGSAIQKLLKLIHFNEKYPENQNLKITNIHDPYIHIYAEGNWKIKKKGKVIDDIIVDKFDMIDINIDSDEDELIEKKNKLENKIVNREKDKFIVNEVTETIINQSKKIFNE